MAKFKTAVVTSEVALIGYLAKAQQEIEELVRDIMADTVDYNADRIYNVKSNLDLANVIYDQLGS